jgi:hypothetical protein
MCVLEIVADGEWPADTAGPAITEGGKSGPQKGPST